MCMKLTTFDNTLHPHNAEPIEVLIIIKPSMCVCIHAKVFVNCLL